MGEIINFQPEKQKENVNLERLEELRSILQEQKGKDPHFDFIDVDKLTDNDLIIFDKVKNHSLTDVDEEFQEYRKEILEYTSEERNKNKDFKAFYDSRSNFLNMLLNKIMVEEYFKRHPEKRAA